MRRRQRRTSGFTIIEVAVSISIMAILVLALGTAVLETVRLEMLAREEAAAQQGLAAELATYYGADRSVLVALSVNGDSFDLTGIVDENINLRPVEGVSFVGSMSAQEVDPVTLEPIASGSSDYFELVARAGWQGMNGTHFTELTAYVLAEDE